MLQKISIFLLFFIISSLHFTFADNEMVLNRDGYGILEYENIEDLLHNPKKITSQAIDDSSLLVTKLASDYHMLSDKPLYELSSFLMDLDKASDLFDRIEYSKDLTADKSIKYPHIQEIHTSYKFLGIGLQYKYKVRVYFDKVTSNEFAMRWKLVDVWEGSLASLTGTWYLREITINNKKYTYIRSSASTWINGSHPGILFLTRTFGEKEINRTFRNLLNGI